MGLFYVLISIIAESAGKTIDKLNFRRTKITARQMTLYVFVTMSAVVAAYVILTHQPFPHLPAAALLCIGLIAIASFASNVFDVLSLKVNDLSLREPLSDFQPIVAGLIGYALFPAERKPGFLLAFVLGAVIVYYGTHRRKLRRFQSKGLFYLLLAVCFESLLPSIYKSSLTYLSPSYVALFRLVSVTLLTMAFFRPPKSRKLSPGKVGYSMLAGFIYAVGAVVSIYAIKELGVVLTMLLLLLGPFLRYSAGYFILKENVRRGEMVSSFLLALMVIVPTVL